MAGPHEYDPGLQADPSEPDPPVVADEAAAELASEDLAERTARLPDPDAERAWWAWWNAEGEGALTRLLRSEWNPLGDDDVPDDEYASYATRLGDLLREGISEQETADFLSEARTGALGLPRQPEEDARVATAVRAWYFAARPGAG
jgi:hypothetical protein